MLGIVFQHQELQIIKGVAKFPADPNSAEQGLTIFDLQNEQYFTLKRNGYQPNIPTHEAVWGDSVLRDGRFPVTGRELNITETIRLTAKADSWQDLAGRLSVLNRLVQDCHDYHETEYQIEPVYLKWWAKGAPGEQYALLYKMDVIVNREDDDSTMMDVRIELEREPFWRGLAPGANPILWHLRDRHADLSVSDLDLISGTDHLATATIQNRHEWDPPDNVNRLSQNFIDIPATSIPGDAPALMLVTFANGVTNDYNNIYIGLSTKPTTLPRSDGSALALQQYNILNMADGTPSSSQAVAVDADGVLSNGSAVNKNISQGTVLSATTTLTRIQRFTGVTAEMMDINMLRGNYAVFCRHNVGSGSDGDLKLQLRYGTLQLQENDETDLFVLEAEGNWQIAYLGLMTIPEQVRAIVSSDGLGIMTTDATNVTVLIELFVRNTAGADRDLEMVDLILMPIDEGFVQLDDLGTTSSNHNFMLGNTGYFSHGEILDVGYTQDAEGNFANEIELRGRIPRLKPNTNNRLYFFWSQYDNDEEVSREEAEMTPRINIIPRWRGIRDVK